MPRRDFLKTSSAALTAAGTVATGTRLQAPTNGRRFTDVVIFLYDRMTALDAIGPFVVRMRPH